MTDHVSTLRIDLEGNLSAEAKLMGEALLKAMADAKKLDDALEQSGASKKMQDKLRNLGAGAAHVEVVTAALKAYKTAEDGIANGKDWTREQINGLKSLEATTSAVIRNKITEEKQAHAQMQRIREEEAREVKRLAEQEIAERRRVAEQAERDAAREASARRRAHERELAEERRHNERIIEQRREAQHRMGFGHYVAGSVVAGVSAHGVVSGIEKAAESGSELQDTRLMMRNAGIDAQMRAKMEQQALDLSRRYANVGQIAIMDLQKEARSVLRDQKEVFGVTEILAKAKATLDAGGGHSEGLGALVKGAESIGAANDPERLAKLIDGYVKAIQVMGKTINPEQIYEFDKYAKSAGATMSDRFLMTTGLSLSQEMGGSTAANDIFHAQKDIVGGFQNKHVPLKELARLGLVDREDLDRTRTGEIKGIKAGHKGVRDAATAQTDLDEWVYGTLLPALEKAGITSQQAQLAEVSKIFTGGESDVISKLITQRESFENHAKMYGNAAGLAGADRNSESASAGIAAVGTALVNLMSNVTVEGMAPVGKVLFTVADGLNALAAAAKNHPDLALGAGVAGGAAALYGAGKMGQMAMNGFGFGGGAAAAAEQVSAAGVQMSAAELQMAAAGKAGAGAAAGAVAGAAEVGAPAAAAAGITAGGLAASVAAVAAPIALAIVAGQKDKADREAFEATKDSDKARALPDLGEQTLAQRLWGMLPAGHGSGVDPEPYDSGRLYGTSRRYNDEARARRSGMAAPATRSGGGGFDVTSPGFVPISYREGEDQVDRGPVEGQGVDQRLELAVAAGTEAGVLAAFARMKNDGTLAGSGIPGLPGGDAGGGGGTGGFSGGGTAGTPNLRYGRRAGGGGYRGTPGADSTAGAFNARAPDKPGLYRPVYNLTDADLSDDVVGTIAGEARTSNAEGVDAVVNNLMNRVGSKGWGPSGNLQQVAMARGQYAGHRRAGAKEAEFIRSRIRAIASGGVPDNTHGANSYRADWYGGPWRQRHNGQGADIGGNYFAYDSSVPNGPYAPYKVPHGTPSAALAGNGSGPAPAGTVGEHLADMKRNGVLKDEQCVTLAMASVGITKGDGQLGSNVHDWRKGATVDSGRMVPGTPIATFLNRDGSQNAQGLYAGGGAGTPGAGLDHAGKFLQYIRNEAGKAIGFKMEEQFQGSGGAHVRDYMFGQGRGEHNGSNYAAVTVRGGGYLGGTRNGMQGGAAAPTATERGGGDAARAVDALDALDGADDKTVAKALGTKMHVGEWCADAVNGALAKAGVEGSGSAMSDSFLKWGEKVAKGAIKRGDVLVESGTRPNGEKLGHVGLANGKLSYDANGRLNGIGMTSGNHGDQVVKDYWEDPDLVTDVRRATKGAVVPRTGPKAPAMSDVTAGLDKPLGIFDHGNIHGAIHAVRQLKREVAELGDASVSVLSGPRGAARGKARADMGRKLRAAPASTGTMIG